MLAFVIAPQDATFMIGIKVGSRRASQQLDRPVTAIFPLGSMCQTLHIVGPPLQRHVLLKQSVQYRMIRYCMI